MGLLSEIYMNGATFAEATSLFTDEALTTLAPDGFYALEGIVRQQISGILGSPQACGSCLLVCGGEPVTVLDGGPGIWYTTFTASDDVGAMIAEVQVGSQAAGFNVNYNGVNYRTLSSSTVGLLTSAENKTYIGESTATFGPFSFTADVYDYVEGEHTFIGTQPAVQLVGMDRRTANNPGSCYMVIPKISTTADPITISAEAAPGTGENNFAVKLHCPRLLTAFEIGALSTASLADACTKDLDGAKYHFPVNGTASNIPSGFGTVGVYDFVFSDQYGAIPLSDGYYRIASDKAMEVQDGVIIDIQDC